jgi:hypothetical protein
VFERLIDALTDALALTAKFWNNRNSQFAWILNWVMSKKYEEEFKRVMSDMDSVRCLISSLVAATRFSVCICLSAIHIRSQTYLSPAGGG